MLINLNFVWLVHAVALVVYSVLLIYLLVNRRWQDPAELRLDLYLGVAFLGTFAFTASHGNWAIPEIRLAFLKFNFYTQAALPLFYFALARAYIRLERQPWIYGSGVVILLALLFADIHGFSTLSESLPPEELVEVLNGYLAIHREIEIYARQLPRSQRLNFRIGLHTGEAIVGNIGTEDLMNYTAVGDTVNVAKRLQENAEPGQTLMSRNTFALIEDRVIVSKSQVLTIKGRTAPVEVFDLCGLRESS